MSPSYLVTNNYTDSSPVKAEQFLESRQPSSDSVNTVCSFRT